MRTTTNRMKYSETMNRTGFFRGVPPSGKERVMFGLFLLWSVAIAIMFALIVLQAVGT